MRFNTETTETTETTEDNLVLRATDPLASQCLTADLRARPDEAEQGEEVVHRLARHQRRV